MFWHDEQIDHRKRLEVVVHQEQVRIVACGQALALGLEGAVNNPYPKLALLALEFEFLVARGAEEISERAVVGEGGNLCVAAVRAVGPCANLGFRP